MCFSFVPEIQKKNAVCLLESTLTDITVYLVYMEARNTDNLWYRCCCCFFFLAVSFHIGYHIRIIIYYLDDFICVFLGVFLQNKDIIWLQIKLMIVTFCALFVFFRFIWLRRTNGSAYVHNTNYKFCDFKCKFFTEKVKKHRKRSDMRKTTSTSMSPEA